jgi:hypothetical protein
MARPLLLLDVDGVLNALPADPTQGPPGYTAHVLRPRGFEQGLLVWLNSSHGPMLRELGAKFDLVWATSWEEQANTMISPLIGLPDDLPWIELGTPRLLSDGIWKRDGVESYVADRPFAWLDDDFEPSDDAWAAAREAAGTPTLLVHVDRTTGLLSTHVTTLHAWHATLDP